MKILVLLLTLGLMFAQTSCTVITGDDGGSKKDDEENTTPTVKGDAPKITKIMGDGADGRIHSSVIVEGENFTKDTLVTISNDDDSVELIANYDGDFTIMAMVPPVIKTGMYKLLVQNENGDDEVDVQVLQGEDGADGEAGTNGLACWDNNSDGEGQPEEDMNEDGEFNAYDCKGPQGEMGEMGPQGEMGQPGPKGKDGVNGKAGSNGKNGSNLNVFSIDSFPESTVANVDEEFTYEIAVNDPKMDIGETYYFYMENGPSGAWVDWSTGVFYWTPSESDAGKSFAVTLVAASNTDWLESAKQEFKLLVVGEDTVFAVTSEPPVFGVAGQDYFYDVEAFDPANPLGFFNYGIVAQRYDASNDEWTEFGDEMGPFMIDPNGQVHFYPITPGPGQMGNDAGLYLVSIVVENMDGDQATQEWYLHIFDAGTDLPTDSFAITSTAGWDTAEVDVAWEYEVTVTNPDTEYFTDVMYSVSTNEDYTQPVGDVTVDESGLFSFTPAEEDKGQYFEFTITASNGNFGWDSETFWVYVDDAVNFEDDTANWGTLDGSCNDGNTCQEFWNYGITDDSWCPGTWFQGVACPTDFIDAGDTVAYQGMCAQGASETMGTVSFTYDDNPAYDTTGDADACAAGEGTWTDAP